MINRLPPYWRKLAGYCVVGGSTFFLDLLLYWYLKTNGVYYLSAASIAFLFSVSLNYIFSRSWVFGESERHFGIGYMYFLFIACVGVGLTVGILQILVEKEGFDPYIGRVFTGALVGMFTFSANYFFNFTMQKHLKDS
jgi:putative flippase GtrA